jgi:hypothetical protein
VEVLFDAGIVMAQPDEGFPNLIRGVFPCDPLLQQGRVD